MSWLDQDKIRHLRVGTAVALDLGDRKGLVRGRIVGIDEEEMLLTGGRLVKLARVKRGRIVVGVYEPGDLVKKPGVPEDEWRGGVVRCRGRDILVESTTGFEWFREEGIEAVTEPAP